jgi:type I restriction enzyme R subunit
VVNLVFARFTRSSILYQQMRGRGTRKAKGKPVFTLFDFVGVADFHGDDDAYAEGGVISARQPRKKFEPRRLLALDIDDHIDPTTRAWITVDENGNLVFPEASEQRAAELGMRFEAWLLAQTALDPGQESWLRMVGHQIRANADHYWGEGAEFIAEQFAFHPFSQLGGLPQAVRVFGSEARMSALIASLNEHMFEAPGCNATSAPPLSDADTSPPPSSH